MSKTLNKFMFKPKTFDDKPVKDSLEAVSLLNGIEPYYLVGGIPDYVNFEQPEYLNE